MSQALATIPTNTALATGNNLTREQIDLLKRTICKDATDDEFALFVSTANRLGLDPFARQIHAVKRWDSKAKREVMAIQVGIDGFRVAAGRTGELDGQEGPFWCGENGEWRDVWLSKTPPSASKVLVFRKGCARPFVGVATYSSYVQTTKDGAPNSMWRRGSDFMLAKCAEAVALRKGFPERLSGVYTPEELAADDREPAAAAPAVGPMPPPSSHVAPTKPASSEPASQPTGPMMTDGEVDAFVEMIGKQMSMVELKKIAALIRAKSPQLTDVQKDLLRSCYEEQADLIEQASQQEANQR